MRLFLKNLLLLLLLLSSLAAAAQTVIGQYEDEAPFQTWNILGNSSARALGMGGVQFALTRDGSAAAVNPALASLGPKFLVSLSGSIRYASLQRYSLINTGPISTSVNPSGTLYGFDNLNIAWRFNKWGFVLNTSILENYYRPSVLAENSNQGIVYYSLRFNQTGSLRSVSMSISRILFSNISIGFGARYYQGNWEKNTEEFWNPGVTITDLKSHESEGFMFYGGLNCRLSTRTTLGAVFRIPYERKAESENRVTFHSQQNNKTISLQTRSDNLYSLPLVLGVGGFHSFSESLRMGLDIRFFQWSTYDIQYFGESLTRDFKDSFKIGTGVEYISSAKLFNRSFRFPLRTGISYDQQPMSDPDSSYWGISFGSGIHSKRLKFDVGVSLAKEFGSGQKLKTMTFLATLIYESPSSKD